ncbi:DUF3107 domain-containing protein [Corynebacterium uterequi]|uniref:Putative DUF3107 family protein n=1 Tax=Corynebacterium uterequi TaxID=1072256 RepID=A0A0G3HEZ7_9CORY|nr:DUF3107 domain-containing protein [Corynebacterium uterequi]AKK10543.1 putative DUF3107 family protein [Corynebacterium uterequi]
MDIKIGFSENQRELVLDSGDDRDEIVARIGGALKDGEFFQLVDNKGRAYFINAEEVAYVEVGSAHRPAVGFGGA